MGAGLAAYAQPAAAAAQRRAPDSGLSVRATQLLPRHSPRLQPAQRSSTLSASWRPRPQRPTRARQPWHVLQASCRLSGRLRACRCSAPSRQVGALRLLRWEVKLAKAHEGSGAAAGLYLPTSDLDVVVVGSGCADVRSALKAMANSLVRRSMGKNIQVTGPRSRRPACGVHLDCRRPY